MQLINTDLIRNPFNWLMVAGMVILAGLALHLIFSHTQATQEQAQ